MVKRSPIGSMTIFWCIEIANDGHVTKYIGVARVVKLDSVRELEHVAAGFAPVDNLIAILYSAGVHRVHHGDLHAGDRLRPPLVHRRDLLHTLLLQPQTKLKDTYSNWIMFFPHVDSIPDVIAVSVRAQQHVGLLYLLLALRTLGITGNPGVDVERLPFRRLHAEGGVAEPCELNSLRFTKHPGATCEK